MHAVDPSAVVTPKFTIRSQGSNVPRRVMGSIGKRDLYDVDNSYWTFSLTPEFTDSFDSSKIAQCLFGDSLCNEHYVKIEGSRVLDRDANALLADYFYLPTDFQSIIEFEPRIRNFLVDINYYLGLDNIMHGMYFWFQAPITWTQWNLDMDERVIDPGVNGYDEGYFTPNALARSELLRDFSAYAIGRTPGIRNEAGAGAITQTVDFAGNLTNVDTLFQGLECSKLCPNKQTKTALSEFRFALGWNFLLCEDYHVGVNLQVSAPTGNKVKSEFLFAPQNGNDHHWELGAGITAHYLFCQSEDEATHFGIYLDANLTHMFKNRQRRCFDLCGKPLSRYMLAARTDAANPADTINLEGAGTLAESIFHNEFAPVANLTTFDVDVTVGVNADIALWFNYTCSNWSWDFGYNFWARSCEKIKFPNQDCDNPCNLNTFAENTWVLKGDSQVIGFMSADDTNLELNDPINLSASMSTATINGGDNFGKTGVTSAQIAAGKANPGINFPQLATASVDDIALNTGRITPPFVGTQINTSIQPVFIKQTDINFARIKGISNKLFYGMTYTWLDRDECEWVPYMGTGFEVEWAVTPRNNDCDDDCNNSCDNSCDNNNSCGKNDCDDECEDENKTFGDCVKCGLSQWGVMARFGVSFN